MLSVATPVRRSVLMLALASGAVLSLAAPSAQTGAQALKSSGPARVCPPPAEPAVAAAPQPTQVARTGTAVDEPTMTGTLRAPGEDPFATRVVVVEWKIKKGRECDFLNYWATRSTIPNRAGLIGEFLSEVDPKPWINWGLDEGWTTFYNVGLWRDAAAFEDQIGKHIDNSRPPLEFEAGKRARVFLAPQRWRVGATTLPIADPTGVQ